MIKSQLVLDLTFVKSHVDNERRGDENAKPSIAKRTVAVYSGAGSLMAPESRHRSNQQGEIMPRTSVSFPPEFYRLLEEIATKKKVSIAWVVREAVERYLADQFPLFGISLLKKDK